MKRLIRNAIIVVLVLVIVWLITSTDGFFTRFGNEREVEEFLLDHIAVNSASPIEVQTFLEEYVQEPDWCGSQRAYNLAGEEEYDEIIVCQVLAKRTWRFSPISYAYTLIFYFSEDTLINIDAAPRFNGF